jgi:peptidoglycan/xylan/chitin deacetylase (PgdA/CDA1 family)
MAAMEALGPMRRYDQTFIVLTLLLLSSLGPAACSAPGEAPTVAASAATPAPPADTTPAAQDAPSAQPPFGTEPPTIPSATPSPAPTPSPQPSPDSGRGSPTAAPTVAPTALGPVGSAQPPLGTATSGLPIPSYPPNAMGDILVLEYHVIGEPEARWTRTPDNFRADMEYLLAHGYYPVNLIDVVRRDLGSVPRGRRPVVITFDDSTEGQFRYLDDGSLDPRSAAGILKAMHDRYGANWPLRATFFVLLGADKPGALLFGQEASGPQKVQTLVEWGMEIGSHTVHHLDLGQASAEQIKWELAVSQNRIEALVPGLAVHSLSVPYGSYPADISLLKEGDAGTPGGELHYRYEAAVKVGGEPAPSPFSPHFDPFYIPRVQAIQSELDHWLGYYEQYPERYYVSDGGTGN